MHFQQKPRLVWYEDIDIAAEQKEGRAPGPRECHVMLQWGEKLIVFAGNDNSNRMHDMYCLDTVNMQWSTIVPKNDAPTQRSALTAALVDDRWIVIFGGWDGEGETGDVHVFDLVERTWEKPSVKGDMPAPRHFHSSAYMPFHRRLLVFGGYDGTGWRNDVYSLDVDSWTWEKAVFPVAQPAPGKRASASTVVVDGDKMMLFGGYDGHGELFLDDAWILHTTDYDGAGREDGSGQVPLTAALSPGPRLGMLDAHGAVLNLGSSAIPRSRRRLKFGWEQVRREVDRPPGHGMDSSRLDCSVSSAGSAAPGAGPGGISYAAGPAWPGGRSGHAVLVLDNLMFLVGGRCKGGRYNDGWALNLDALSWHPIDHTGDTFSERKTHTLGCVGSRLFLFGGNTGRGWSGDMFVTDVTPVLRALAPKLTVPVPPSTLLSDWASVLAPRLGIAASLPRFPTLLCDDRAILPLRSDTATCSEPACTALYRHRQAAPALPPRGSRFSELVPYVRLARPLGAGVDGDGGGSGLHDTSFDPAVMDEEEGGEEGEGQRSGRKASAPPLSLRGACALLPNAVFEDAEGGLEGAHTPWIGQGGGALGVAVGPAFSSEPGLALGLQGIMRGAGLPHDGCPPPRSVMGESLSLSSPIHLSAPRAGAGQAYPVDAYEPIFRERWGSRLGPGESFLAGPTSPSPSPMNMSREGEGGGASVGKSVPLISSWLGGRRSASKGQGMQGHATGAMVQGMEVVEDGAGGDTRHAAKLRLALAPPFSSPVGGSALASSSTSEACTLPCGASPGGGDGEGEPHVTHARALTVSGTPAPAWSPDGALFSDVTFLVGGEHVHLHRVVLAARSEYFKALLLSQAQAQGQGQDSHSRVIALPDTDLPVFTALVRWLYTDQLPPTADMECLVLPLLAEAQKTGIHRLSRLCQRYLEYRVTVDNAAVLLEFADTHGARHLRRAALDFICTAGPAIEDSDGFIGLREDLLREALTAMRADRVRRQGIRARIAAREAAAAGARAAVEEREREREALARVHAAAAARLARNDELRNELRNNAAAAALARFLAPTQPDIEPVQPVEPVERMDAERRERNVSLRMFRANLGREVVREMGARPFLMSLEPAVRQLPLVGEEELFPVVGLAPAPAPPSSFAPDEIDGVDASFNYGGGVGEADTPTHAPAAPSVTPGPLVRAIDAALDSLQLASPHPHPTHTGPGVGAGMLSPSLSHHSAGLKRRREGEGDSAGTGVGVSASTPPSPIPLHVSQAAGAGAGRSRGMSDPALSLALATSLEDVGPSPSPSGGLAGRRRARTGLGLGVAPASHEEGGAGEEEGGERAGSSALDFQPVRHKRARLGAVGVGVGTEETSVEGTQGTQGTPAPTHQSSHSQAHDPAGLRSAGVGDMD